MAATLTAWPKLPKVQNHFRTGLRRTQAAITICGTMEPDSRMGTSQATSAGAPTALINHASTVLGLIRRSPSLVSTLAARIRKKFCGTTWQASAGISLQTRASSSLATKPVEPINRMPERAGLCISVFFRQGDGPIVLTCWRSRLPAALCPFEPVFRARKKPGSPHLPRLLPRHNRLSRLFQLPFQSGC